MGCGDTGSRGGGGGVVRVAYYTTALRAIVTQLQNFPKNTKSKLCGSWGVVVEIYLYIYQGTVGGVGGCAGQQLSCANIELQEK